MRIIARVDPGSTYVKNMRDVIARGDTVIVDYLLERGCDLNRTWDTFPRWTTGLDLAGNVSDPEVAAATFDVLLRHGADIQQMKTPFSGRWKDKKHLIIIRVYLKNGADPNPDRSAWAQRVLLLAMAIPSHYVNVVQCLLKAICAQGVPLDYFQKLLHSLEERVQYEDDGRSLKRDLENAYWRRYTLCHGGVPGVRVISLPVP